MREQDYCSESHYRIVLPTFQYRMSHQRVGKCIIINNKNFDEKTGRAKTCIKILSDVILVKAFTLSKWLVCIKQGWMYAMVLIEMLASSTNASRALVLMFLSTMTRHVRRWNIFSERVRPSMSSYPIAAGTRFLCNSSRDLLLVCTSNLVLFTWMPPIAKASNFKL